MSGHRCERCGRYCSEPRARVDHWGERLVEVTGTCRVHGRVTLSPESWVWEQWVIDESSDRPEGNTR
jgi:hypothetical protein